LVGDFFYGGRSVFIHHGAGLMTVYHHLSRPLVAVGDTVTRGQIIGLVGATGRVTGPHLHWAAQYGFVAFDPTDLLTLFPAAPAAAPD
jgi:murein DD-endopeptidase MepM/ murein hydrolase activator NlpD